MDNKVPLTLLYRTKEPTFFSPKYKNMSRELAEELSKEKNVMFLYAYKKTKKRPSYICMHFLHRSPVLVEKLEEFFDTKVIIGYFDFEFFRIENISVKKLIEKLSKEFDVKKMKS